MKQNVIEIAVSPESAAEQEAQAGVMYEHNATAVRFVIDEAYVQSGYRYYVEFVTVNGVSRTAYLNPEAGKLEVSLPLEVTSQMTALCILNIVQIAENGKTELLVKASRVRLYFSVLENTDKQIDADHAFSVNTLLEAIEKGTFKGDKGDRGERGPKGDKGDKGDPGVPVDAKVTETSPNPVSSAGLYSFVGGRTERLIAELTVGPEGYPGEYIVAEDVNGKAFSLQSVRIYGKLIYEPGENPIRLRIRTNQGSRFLARINDVKEKGEVCFFCHAYNAKDFMTASETIYGKGGQGIEVHEVHPTICTTYTKPMENFYIGIYYSNEYMNWLPLKEGSKIVITGVDEH